MELNQKEWTIELGPVAWILNYQLVSLILAYESSYTGLGLEPHWLAQDSQGLAMVDFVEFPFVFLIDLVASPSKSRLEPVCRGF